MSQEHLNLHMQVHKNQQAVLNNALENAQTETENVGPTTGMDIIKKEMTDEELDALLGGDDNDDDSEEAYKEPSEAKSLYDMWSEDNDTTLNESAQTIDPEVDNKL